jgi:hypothetical protein
MESFTRDDAVRAVRALRKLHEKLAQFLNECGQQPGTDSCAAEELRSYQRPELLETAYDQGSMLIEAAADQLMGFTKAVTEPVQTVAPWGCVRGVVECSALAAWLLDPGLEARERVQRSFALRYEGLSQQVKIGGVAGREEDVRKARARIDHVETVAIQLGFRGVKNKKGKRTGIGQQMPSITQVVARTLDRETTYRLLSAMTHAHHWALSELAFRKVKTDELPQCQENAQRATGHLLEKSLAPISVLFLSREAVYAFSIPIRHKCSLFGWDMKECQRILDSASAVMGFEHREPSSKSPLGC